MGITIMHEGDRYSPYEFRDAREACRRAAIGMLRNAKDAEHCNAVITQASKFGYSVHNTSGATVAEFFDFDTDDSTKGLYVLYTIRGNRKRSSVLLSTVRSKFTIE